MYKPLLVFAVFSASLPGLTQTSTPAPDARTVPITVSYAGEAVVVERDDVVYRYAADGAGSKLETSILRVQSNAALQSLAVLNFPYASGNQRLDIVYARVRKPDGIVVETPTADSQDQPAQVTQLAPTYSDLHSKQLPVRSLSVGDTLEFQVRVTRLQADIPGEFWGQENFGAGIIFLERGIELRVPRQKQLTVYSPGHEPEITESGDERVYRWTGSQLRSPSAKVDAEAVADTTPPIAWTTFPSWEAVGLWYRGVILGRDAVTPAIQARADELTAQSKTDVEKVQALYNYVSTHNHYIGVDFGIGRYQPHLASEVMTNQYGDCKDKHTLLAALLRAKGFQASAVLIGEGIAINDKVPMPAAFNHVITLVDVGGEKVWLDATTEVAPYRVLLPVLRDKEALVVPAAGTPQLIKTPALLPFPALTSYEAKYQLDTSGAFKGHVEISLRGDDEVLMRLAARQATAAQWDQMSQAYSNGSGLSGTTSLTSLDPADDLSGPWRLRYDYTQTAFSEWGSYRIGALLPNLQLPTVDEKNPPKNPIELSGPHIQLAGSTITLPAGYSADLPDAIHLKTPFASYDRTYAVNNGKLVTQIRLETLIAKLPASEWKSYKKFVDDIGVEPWIQLTGKGSVAGEKAPPLPGENNRAAAELVRQVHDAIVARDFDLAKQKSDQALAINERQSYLWSQRGFLAGRRNDNQEAAADFEREIAQHPENLDQYSGLIYAEQRAGHKDKEHQYLLAYAKAAPDKEPVVLYVGGHLRASNNLKDAIAVYRSGVQATPENKTIQVELGSTLLQNGDSGEGVMLIKAAMADTTDPGILNSGSYALAEHQAELPLAETSARKAVDLLETESRQTVLDGVNAHSFQRANLLLASWDTLGWIYYIEGKLNLAGQYILAAWQSGAQAEVGLHWGQVLEKRGDRTPAMRIYELALSQARGDATSPVTLELHARVDALKKDGVPAPNANAVKTLQDKRTFHTRRPSDLKGSAIFVAQVSAGRTENVSFLSGDEPLRGETATLAHLDLRLDLPTDSHALLLRSGILFCSTQPECDFVLTPPESAYVK